MNRDTFQALKEVDQKAKNRFLDYEKGQFTEKDKINLAEVKQVFKKWLYLRDETLIDVVLGCIIANRSPSDPVWLFIVAPPGGTKTEVLRSLKTSEIYQVSSLSQHSLISGFMIKSKNKAKDPSLLPVLDGKVLVIKDFTTIISMDRHAREEILATLRDAYDGEAKKTFGSEATVRSYKSKFGLLAGVTPEIDRIYSVSQSLGERFIKYRTPIEDREGIINRASKNMGKEKEMRAELSKAVAKFLFSVEMRDISVSDELEKKLVSLALLIARLRSAVSRDGYKRNVQFMPEAEVGTRLLKQLKGLAQGIALARAKNEITREEYEIVAKIAKDTLPSKRLSLLQAIIDQKEHVKTSVIAQEIKLHTDTAREMLEDYWLLEVVDRSGDENAGYTWCMKDSMRQLIFNAEL